jgi:hypothetical protein
VHPIRRWLAVVAVPILVALAPAGASAAELAVEADPNDTPGKLDMSGIGMEMKNNGNLFVGIRTFGEWTNPLLAEGSGNKIVFSFNLDRDREAEYTGTITTVDDTMQLVLEGRGGPYDPIEVERIGPSAIQVRFRQASPVNEDGVKVFAKTRLTGGGRCSDTCVDRAPDHGSISF